MRRAVQADIKACAALGREDKQQFLRSANYYTGSALAKVYPEFESVGKNACSASCGKRLVTVGFGLLIIFLIVILSGIK